MKQEPDYTYTLLLNVRTRPDIVVRCAQVLSRRNHSIETLHITQQSESTGTSLMTITAYGKREGVNQIIVQLKKLTDVTDAQKKEA